MKKIAIYLSEQYPAVYRFILYFLSSIFNLSSRRKIKGKGNIVSYRGSFLRYCRFDISGNNNRIEIAQECRLNNVEFFIRGDGHLIQIGSQVRIGDSALLWCEDERGTIIIGKNTHIAEVHIAVTELESKIEIGSHCLFSRDIEIRCGDSHSILDTKTGKRINPAGNVKIDDRVWIGRGAKILKGVEIGSDSIVATGAVVTKSIPSGVIVAGNPAKLVREGIRWVYERL